MYSNKIKRDSLYLEKLTGFISDNYGLNICKISEASRGYYGETWKIETSERFYFAKISYYDTHKQIYKDSFAVMEYITSQGIDFISEIIKTTDGRLYTEFDSAVLGIFNWIDGENIQNEESKIKEYDMLTKIYKISSDVDATKIKKEDFSLDSFSEFSHHCEHLKEENNTVSQKILSLFETKLEMINHYKNRLILFSEKCRNDKNNFYITHGDAGGNIILNGDKSYIIDWDLPVLAPPERDAWFCMHWDWSMTAFNEALIRNGVNYQLKPERLAYYCYQYFFYYLNCYLQAYFDLSDISKDEFVDQIAEYFTCWIQDNLEFSDKIK